MISLAESITGGKIGSEIVNISGSSKFFKGSIVCYSLDSKINILGLSEEDVKINNAVSQNVAEQMALNVSKLFGTEIGLGISGFAEVNDIIKEPHAYISICKNLQIVYSIYIVNNSTNIFATNLLNGKTSKLSDQNKQLERNEFREFLTQLSLQLLKKYCNISG